MFTPKDDRIGNENNDQGHFHSDVGANNPGRSDLLCLLARSVTGSLGIESLETVSRYLQTLAGLMNAERILLIRISDSTPAFSAIKEWALPDLPSVKSLFDNLAFEEFQLWKKFRTHPQVFQFSNVENIPDSYDRDKTLLRSAGTKSFLQVPVIVDDKVWGFLAIFGSNEGTHWSPNDYEFLEAVAGMLGNIMEKLKTRLGATSHVKEANDETLNKDISLKNLTDYPSLMQRVFSGMEYGIAFFDTSRDEFIFINPRFSELFGFEHLKFFNKDQVFKIFRKNGYDINDFFAENTVMQKKDFSLTFRDRFLLGHITPVGNTKTISITLNDISPLTNAEKNEKEFNEQLRILSEAAINLISLKKENIYEFIGDTAFALLKNCIVLVNSYDPDEQVLHTRCVKGFGIPMDLISKLIGKHPLNKTYPLAQNSSTYERILNAPVAKIEGGLPELALGVIPEPVARQIEKVTGTSNYYGCGLCADGKLYGTLILMLRNGVTVRPFILETLSRMASTALHTYALSSQLEKTTSILSHATRIAKMGYWQYDFCKKKLTLSKDLVRDIIQDIPVSQDTVIPAEVFLRKYVYPDDIPTIREKLEQALKNSGVEGYSDEFEWKFKRKGREPLHIYSRGVVQKGGWILGIAQDITQIRRTQQKLKESEVKFQNMVEQSLDAIVVIQDDGKIMEWNRRAESITSMPANQVKGKYIWDVESELIFRPESKKIPPHYSPEVLQKRFHEFFHYEMPDERVTSDISIRNLKGEIRYVSVTSFVFKADERKYLCRIVKDVTNEKQKQERDKQREISHQTAMAKQMFLDNMSHEMRTPLNGIIGMTDLLLHAGLNDHQKDLLGVIKESSDSLLELISNIHELSRIEADRIVIQHKMFNPTEMLQKTAGIFKAAAHQKEINLDLQIHANQDLCLVGDEFRLQQVLTNLLANALKFTPHKGYVLLESSITDHGEKMEFFVKVKDTGIGIPEDKIPILFDKFTQADGSFTRQYEGLGIGLSISKELVELMGGEIGVSSAPGQGSEFWIRVSLDKC
jgi:PAS domain S-box-containing protein